MEVVRRDQSRVPEDLSDRGLDDCDGGEEDCLDGDDEQTLHHHLPSPLDGDQRRVQRGERYEEECDDLCRRWNIDRPDRLERVEDHGSPQHQVEGSGGESGRARFARDDGVPECCDHRGGDHQVERDQQVRGIPTELDRYPEGQSCHQQEWQGDHVTSEEPRERSEERQTNHG